MSDETAIELNYGHYFELLDRVYIARENMARNLGEHPVVLVEPALKQALEQVDQLLAQMYEALSAKMTAEG